MQPLHNIQQLSDAISDLRTDVDKSKTTTTEVQSLLGRVDTVEKAVTQLQADFKSIKG